MPSIQVTTDKQRETDATARFSALVTPHIDRLLAFSLRRTETQADAEDAVQEAFLRAWLGFDDLRNQSLVRPWLYRILRTVLADEHDKRTRRSQIVSITRLETALEDLIGGDPDEVFVQVTSRMTREMVHAALRSIPDEFAIPVELHDIDGFKYSEIAEIVGVPIGTVMSRISRGRRLLAGAVASTMRSAHSNRAESAGGHGSEGKAG
jgi:RNA polymerase sigma-70 factor (ECF subfamily)